MLSIIKRRKLYSLMYVITLLLFTGFLYKIYIFRINAFGCFDDCNNFMGGYFLLHGKKLFSEIFFNHAPGMAYISFFVQYLFHPINLYELILRHRQFIILVGFFGNLFLLLRFRWKIIGFILLYELSKFYLFGDRFLAEAIIVYLLVYLGGLTWDKITNKPLTLYDYIISAVFTWFVIFTREPYVPLSIFLFATLMIGKEKYKEKTLAISILIILSVITLLYHNISDLIFNVFTVNIINIQAENKTSHVFGIGIFQSFLYPFWILISGETNYFRSILISLGILFLAESVWFIYTKRYTVVLFVWITLGLANLRFVQPGKEFYEAFHMLVWYGLFLFFSFSFLVDGKIHKIYKYFFVCLYGFIVLFLLISKESFLHENINEYTEFITNYGVPLQTGNVVHTLSTQNDSVFLDGFDDIIYWVSQRVSQYPYSWYTSLMPGVGMYTNARITMFHKNPPDFYYGSCPEEKKSVRLLPNFIKNDYIRLYNLGKPSCLWVKKTKLISITNKQWYEAKQLLYTLPETR